MPVPTSASVRVAIPLFDDFTALDAIGPFEVLWRMPNAEVQFVAVEPGLKRPDIGFPGIEATVPLSDVTDPDIIVVPGGLGVDRHLGGSPLVDWIREVHERTTWTTSVCTGSLLLAAAGLLDGIEATTHWLSYDKLAAMGAHPTSRRVVEVGKIITAAGVSSGIDMALTLAAKLAGPDVAQAIQLSIEYDPQPPFDTGSPDKAGDHLIDLVKAATARRRARMSAA